MRAKYLTKKRAKILNINLSLYPNFSSTGSIKGMKEKYYGKNGMLIKSGSYIYNVPENIYNIV